MARLTLILALLFACLQAPASAEQITTTFGFPTMGGPNSPIPVTGLTKVVVGNDATFTFNLKITAASGTATHLTGSGGLGVVGGTGPNDEIDGAGEDLTFVLTVSVSGVNPNGGNITPYDLSFGTVTLRSASLASDTGSFQDFDPPNPGPGGPNPPTSPVYTWADGTTSDFPGMTGDPTKPAFDLFRMNGAPISEFTHVYVGPTIPGNRFLFNDLKVSVVATPEPSSWMLGLLAASLLLIRWGWKRFRLVPSPSSV